MIHDRFINACSLTLEHIDQRRQEFSHAKLGILAMMALESNWGTSGLAKHFCNFAGLKWRKDMILPECVKIEAVDYRDWQERKTGTKGDLDIRIFDIKDWPTVFFAFLSRERYKGIEAHCDRWEDLVEFLLGRGYCGSFPGAKSIEEVRAKYFSAISTIISSQKFAKLIETITLPDWLQT